MNQDNTRSVYDFENFVKTYGDAVYNYLNKLAGDGMDAEDIMQEALLKIADGLPELRDPAKIKTWAFRIATNAAIDFLRGRNKSNTVFDESLINDADGGDDIEDRAVVDEMSECIRREMGRLASHYHTVMVLHYFEQMSVAEISKICEISESTVKIRLHRGRLLLNRMLSEGCNFYYDRNSNMRCSSRVKE